MEPRLSIPWTVYVLASRADVAKIRGALLPAGPHADGAYWLTRKEAEEALTHADPSNGFKVYEAELSLVLPE